MQHLKPAIAGTIPMLTAITDQFWLYNVWKFILKRNTYSKAQWHPVSLHHSSPILGKSTLSLLNTASRTINPFLYID